MNYNRNKQVLTFYDYSQRIDINISFSIENVIRYIMSNYKENLKLVDGMYEQDGENEEIEWYGDYNINYENNKILLKIDKLMRYDGKNRKQVTDNIIIKSKEKEIIMKQEEYIKNWLIVLKKINPYYKLNNLYNVKLLWHWSYNNGPVTGICNFNGRKYYCNMIHYPIYTLHYLSNQEINDAEYYHKIRKTYVGNHNEYVYDQHGISHHALCSSTPNIYDFLRFSSIPATYDFNKYKQLTKDIKTDYTANKIVGWFILK